MTKSFLIVAGCLLVAPAAWAGPAPAQQGSGNNVSTALNPPAPAPTPDSTVPTGDRGVRNAPPGSGNNVNTALAPPAAAPKPGPAPASAQTAQAPQAPAFNASLYPTAADCLTAASAAQQPLSMCSGFKEKK